MKLVRPIIITDAILDASNVAETDYAAWAGGTTYAEGDRVRVVDTDVHVVFESLAGSNTGNDPEEIDSEWWIQVSATNRWKMFDQAVQSQTTNATSIEVDLDIPGRIDSLALLNLFAAEAHVTLTDDIDGVVYDQTFDLVSDSGITDWYAWFYEPIERLSDLVLVDLPASYLNPLLTVELTATGETVACGACIPGMSRDLGGTQWAPRLGIQDYSVKQRNDFGDYTVLERAFNRTASFTVWVDPGFVDQLINILAGYRATPVVWIGDPDYASTAVYGFFKDFNVEIAGPTKSICSLEIEGLV